MQKLNSIVGYCNRSKAGDEEGLECYPTSLHKIPQHVTQRHCTRSPNMLPNVTAQDPPTCYPTSLHKIPQHVTQRLCTRSPNMLPNVSAQDPPTCYPTSLHKIPQHVTQHHCTSPPGLPFLYLHIRSDQIFKVMRRQCSTFNRADSHEEVNQLLP